MTRPEKRASAGIGLATWLLTLVTLVAVVLIGLLLIEEHEQTAAAYTALGVIVWSLVVLGTMSGRAMSQGREFGYGLMSALVSLFVIIPVSAGVVVLAGVSDAADDVHSVFDGTGDSGDG